MSDQINIKKIESPMETKYLDFLYKLIKDENSDAIISSLVRICSINISINY